MLNLEPAAGGLVCSFSASRCEQLLNETDPHCLRRPAVLEHRARDRFEELPGPKLSQLEFRQQVIQRIVVGVELTGDLLDGLQELGIVQGGLDGLGHRRRASEQVLEGVAEGRSVAGEAVQDAQAARYCAGGGW